MKLWLLGVRGSTAAPGAQFTRYGGHTSCVAVLRDGADTPSLVLDAGTGLRELSARLGNRPYVGDIALTHLHWDHVMGLPFFVSGDRDGARVGFYVPAQVGLSGRDLLARLLAPPWFPIEPEGLNGEWTFDAIEPGRHSIGGLSVTAAEVAHKGGRTYGYRVADAGRSFAYLPDHAPARGVTEAARDLVAGVDVLLHDAQYLDSERTVADNYGHATVEDAVEVAAAAKVGRLVLIHHSAGRTDDQLDAMAARVSAPMPVSFAREGDVVEVGTG